MLEIRRIAYALGAEVRGVDLAEPLDEQTLEAIRAAWLEHLVLHFPGQQIAKPQLIAFSRRFGELEVVRKEYAEAASRNVDLLTNKPINGKPWDGFQAGRYWHTDESFMTHPTSAAFLYCREIPEAGGDTMFANCYLAYEALSPAMQRLVDGLWAIHDHPVARRNDPSLIPTAQPLVRVHPQTNRKALFLGKQGPRIRRIVGMTLEESTPLLDFLNRHAVRYEFTYRHRWKVDDLVMWDNRCLLHVALADYDMRRQFRYMERTACIGEESGRPYAGEAAAV